MPIKELIREIDAEEEEKEYVANKFKEHNHLVDAMARKNLKKIPLPASACKYYCGYNHYGEIDQLVNAGTTTNECPRCSEVETWEHVVQCRKTVSMRAGFTLALFEDIKKSNQQTCQMQN